MSDNLIREKHLTSLGSAVKNYVDNNLSNDLILDTTPSTQNGSLWYELQNSKPVIKFFHAGQSYSVTPVVDVRDPNLTFTSNTTTVYWYGTASATLSFAGDGTVTAQTSSNYGHISFDSSTKVISVAYTGKDPMYSWDETVSITLSAADGYSSATAAWAFYVES